MLGQWRRMETRIPTLPLIALLIGSMGLAFGPWLVRLADVGPIAAGFWRLGLGGIMLGMAAPIFGRSIRPPGRISLILIVIAAFFFAADIAAWHIGILLTKMGNATLFGNVGSFLFALYGLFLLRRRPAPTQLASILLALGGSLLLLAGSYELSASHFRGDLLALLAALLYAVYLVVIDKVRRTEEPLTTIFWASLAGAAFVLPMALIAGETIIPTNWTPVLLLAFSSQLVGQGLVVYAMGKLPPLVIGIGLMTQIALSAALGWWRYGEAFTPLDWVGVIFVLSAVILVRLRTGPRKTS